MFFDVMAKEEGGPDIRHIDPGIVDTNMQAVIRAAGRERFVALAEEGQLQKPEAVAERILREHFYQG